MLHYVVFTAFHRNRFTKQYLIDIFKWYYHGNTWYSVLCNYIFICKFMRRLVLYNEVSLCIVRVKHFLFYHYYSIYYMVQLGKSSIISILFIDICTKEFFNIQIQYNDQILTYIILMFLYCALLCYIPPTLCKHNTIHVSRYRCNIIKQSRLIHSSGPETFKKSKPKKLVKSNKSISRIFLTKFYFLQFQKWPKINF